MSFAWKDDHMETFLEIYWNHECLWNNKSENYHKTNIREKAYKILHTELNLAHLSVNDIRAKIKTIRTRYCSELAKIRKSEKSGAGSNELIVVSMLPIVLAGKVLPTTDEVDVSFSFLIFSNILLPGLNLLTQSRHSLIQSPTFWKLVKRIEPLKDINTPAFIVHFHWWWIIFDAHPEWTSVNSL